MNLWNVKFCRIVNNHHIFKVTCFDHTLRSVLKAVAASNSELLVPSTKVHTFRHIQMTVILSVIRKTLKNFKDIKLSPS